MAHGGLINPPAWRKFNSNPANYVQGVLATNRVASWAKLFFLNRKRVTDGAGFVEEGEVEFEAVDVDDGGAGFVKRDPHGGVV